MLKYRQYYPNAIWKLRSDLLLLYVRTCVRVYVCAPANDKIGRRIKLSLIRVFESNVQNVQHYSYIKHNRNLLSKFSNINLNISGVIPS